VQCFTALNIEPLTIYQTHEQQCEEGWTKFQGNCYLHFPDRETWLEAEQRCRDLKAHLVMKNMLSFPTAHAQDYQWIGLNDKTSNLVYCSAAKNQKPFEQFHGGTVSCLWHYTGGNRHLLRRQECCKH
uniref:C-type lectin domain-containing protein n=1 Tax=Mola mola TaxID=94237 RepID=A0A3Q4BN10_MOLML